VTRERVPVGELVDVSQLGRDGRPPTPRELRAALPRGWAFDDDGRHAVRDARLFFSQSWVLIAGLLVFGSAAIAIFASTLPHGWRGVTRVAILLALVVLIGGVIGPLVTRALHRR